MPTITPTKNRGPELPFAAGTIFFIYQNKFVGREERKATRCSFKNREQPKGDHRFGPG